MMLLSRAAKSKSREHYIPHEWSLDSIDALLRTNHMIAWDWDLRANKVKYSTGAKEILGLLSDDPNDFNRLIYPVDQEIVAEALRLAIEETGVLDIEFRISFPNGQMGWLSAQGKVYYDDEQMAIGAAGICTDITKRKLAHEELRKYTDRLRLLTEISESFLAANQTSACSLSSIFERICALLGLEVYAHYTLNEKGLFELVSCKGLSQCDQEKIASLKPGQEIDGDKIVAGRQIVLNHLQTNPLAGFFHDTGLQACVCQPLTAGNKVIGVLVFGTSFSSTLGTSSLHFIRAVGNQLSTMLQRQHWENELRNSEAFNRSLLEASVDCIKVLNLKGQLMYINSSGMDLLETKDTRALLNKNWTKSWPEDARPTIEHAVEEAKSGRPCRFQAASPTLKGNLKWWDVQVSPLYDSNRQIYGFLAVSRDISDRIKMEEDLVEARNRADMANAAKSEFLANMSHEIRTPMNAIIGLANILNADNTLPEKNRTAVRTLKTSAQTLLELINDLLDIEKIETKSISFEKIAFCFDELVEEVFSLLQAKAEERKITMSYCNAECSHLQFLGDPLRIRQILINLVSNAIKFTSDGSITVRIERDGTDDNSLVRLSVADTGIGIASDKLDHIFEKFTQADSSTTRQYGGTGLGLAICKSLVEVMGGDIGVTSQLGRGSEFTVTLPLQTTGHSKTVRKAEKASLPVTKERPRLLLVEDYPANILVATMTLENMGYDVVSAPNGEEALQILQKEHDRFMAVLMDVQMPVMDGLETTQRLRQLSNDNGWPRLPVIAMTAHVLQGDRERCLQAGMDHYIAKPFREEELGQLLAQHHAGLSSQSA